MYARSEEHGLRKASFAAPERPSPILLQVYSGFTQYTDSGTFDGANSLDAGRHSDSRM